MKCFAALALVFALSTTAYSKGSFLAEGGITGLKRSDNEITFQFSGAAGLRYPPGPEAEWKIKRNSIVWTVTDVPVRIVDGATRSEFESAFDKLSQLSEDKRAVSIAFRLDNPTLTFSSTGEISEISGTFISAQATYAVE